MNADETTNISVSEADLARLLPTCQRCRRLRRKCDTQLPACRLCQKGKAECTFFDHALQQTLPRSYVDSLLTRLSRLKSVQAALTGDGQGPQHSNNPARNNAYVQYEPPPLDWASHPAEATFDKHFVMSHANPTCWQFFGSSSVYALAVEVLVHARAKVGVVTQDENYGGPQFWLNAQPADRLDVPVDRPTPDPAEINELVSLFLTTTNVLFQAVDEKTVAEDIDTYLNHQQGYPRALTGREAHQFFRASMMCAIAAADRVRHRPEYLSKSMMYYADALQCVEEVTSDVSPDALVALLLLIGFSLFYPRKGDIWKLLDFACRLSVELEYHTETNDQYEDEHSRNRRRSMFWGLYTVERTIGQHLGRPSDLPEEIVTAAYPVPLDAPPTADLSDQQRTMMSHYYRLTYLRSEIFREVYLPAVAPDLPHLWYQQRLGNILAWRQELPQDLLAGPGGFTCDIAVDTSTIFLFQPLLLRALNSTREAALAPENRDIIPRQSYHSACRLIEQYSKIIHAPEDHPYGHYPLTLISAHYVQTAAMTVLAHCLLALDARLPVLTFVSDLSQDNPPPQDNHPQDAIDFRGIFRISDTCLGLLDKIAELLPGMLGMRDIYCNVAEKILPVMARSGLA